MSSVFFASACQPSLPEVDSGLADAGVQLRFSPAAPSYGSPVYHASWARVRPRPFPRLFVERLTAYHRNRSLGTELPSTLSERLVPLFVFDQNTQQIAVPLRQLSIGDYEFQLGAREWFPFHVAPRQGTWFRRMWPPSDSPVGGAVFCLAAADGRAPTAKEIDLKVSGELELLPDGIASFERIDDSCVAVAPSRVPLSGALTPTKMAGWPLEATVFSTSSAPAEDSQTSCPPEFEKFVIGCVQLQDDRLLVEGPDFHTYWAFRGALAATGALAPGERRAFRGLSESAGLSVSVVVFDEFGRRFYATTQLDRGATRSHVIINEVMANPLGPEPAQEWVELYNDGQQTVVLGGYQLGDAQALAELPVSSIQPGRFVVVVSEAFDEGLGWEAVPEEKVAILRVSGLGQFGLSNSGESLQLLSPLGRVVSTFPSLPKPGPGVSVARRLPWSPDGSNGSFGLHSAPGASPGSTNAVQ